MVSAPANRYISTELTVAKTSQAGSSQRCPPSGAEAVPDIAHRLDVFVAELAAQPPDIDVDHVALRVEAQSPDIGQQLVAGAHLVGATHEVRQQHELTLRQRRTSSFDVDHAFLEIETHAADFQPAERGATRRLGQPSIDTSDELGHRERLGQVVDGAFAQAVHPRLDVTDGGQDEHPDVAVLGAQALEDREAVDAGKKE